ncbi:7-cyano-7-deazaguanine synthase [Luteitalea pratensis]|uniref:7-cyano-7-deazaguanine synthase n=1 Tax=Luteitalea pratensis TaxID=1855912 RepID=A0A143PIG0_LUTPR|nr:7-cyano-7-deazaguanine synthase [Luteitalea pratensis]AMY07569.1 7-cyano-7-deazaguanine synthase [Luteitalea pratensis]
MLCSGGLDSVVLAADLATTAPVQPIYVASGLAWEAQERAMLERALACLPDRTRVAPLHVLDASVRDVYAPTHWSLAGTPPSWDTPDEDVYLVGRNIVLLGKAAVYCALRKIGRIALGPLAGNPFPDATAEFYESMARALSLGLAHPIAIETPYRTLHKSDVIRRGHAIGAPMALTLSCMNPLERIHCGACSKCRERHDAFMEALGQDQTIYAADRGTSTIKG